MLAPRSVIALLLIVAPLGASSALDRVGEDLRRAVRAELTAANRALAVRSLCGQGAAVIPALIELLGEDSLEAPAALEPAQREVALQALAELPREAVLQAVAASLDGSTPSRVLALEIVGASCSAAQTARLFDLATPAAESDPIERQVSRALSAAVRHLAQRDKATLNQLAKLVADVDPRLWPAVVEALAGAPTELGERSHRGLLDLLHLDGELDGTVLAAMSKYVDDKPPGTLDAWRTSARWFLGDLAPDRQRRAAHLAGRLCDVEAVPDLIELLDSEHASVRQSSVWALESMSNARLGLNVEAWQGLFDEEQTWWHNEYRGVRDELLSRNVAAINQAIRAVAARRFFRHEVVSDLAQQLSGRDPENAVLAARGLALLDSPRAIPYLRARLADGNPEVHAAVLKALQSLGAD